MDIENKLKELGIKIPKLQKPKANYIPAKVIGDIIYCSGQGSIVGERILYKGKLGQDLSIDEGYESARQAVLSCLAVLKDTIGDLNKIINIIKVNGFIASSNGFNQQHKVLNGASDLLVEIFGEKGKHARAAIGVNELPLNISVEVELIAEIIT